LTDRSGDFGDFDPRDVVRAAQQIMETYGRTSPEDALDRAWALERDSMVPHFAAAVRKEIERMCAEQGD
jgi:hypothetical protein